MKNFLLFFLVINSLNSIAQLIPKSINSAQGVIGFYEYKPADYKPDSSYNYPLIIFLHGIGERGNGNSELPMALNSSFAKILNKGATLKFTVNAKQHAFLVLIPQMAKSYINWQNFYVDSMISYAKRNLRIDTNKIFLTGWSLGGGGAWKYGTASVTNASKLAGIIPVAAAPDYTDLCNLALGKVAVWTHHALDDASVPIHYTEDAVTAINACHPLVPAQITYYPFGGHPYVADKAYDTINDVEYPNIYQWMIGTSRGNTPENNQPPVANAGRDTTVILSSRTAILNGTDSYDPNDVVVSYQWSMLSGPVSSELSIQKPSFPSSTVTGLENGRYIFKLTVRDQFGVIRMDEVNVNVILPPDGANASPVLDAGPDITIKEDSYYTVGSARDFDGNIKKVSWRQISGPSSLTVQEMEKSVVFWGFLKAGLYAVEMSALDDNTPAGVGRDTIYITKEPSSPMYFTYLSNQDPAIIDGDITRYGSMVTFLLISLVPALIFNRFINKKLLSVFFRHLLIIEPFCYFGTFFILLRPLTQFQCI